MFLEQCVWANVFDIDCSGANTFRTQEVYRPFLQTTCKHGIHTIVSGSQQKVVFWQAMFYS